MIYQKWNLFVSIDSLALYLSVWNIQSGLQSQFDAYLLVPYQLLCLSHVDEDVALKNVQNYVVNFYHFLFTFVHWTFDDLG
jgi:hypothetical protein